MQSKRLTYCALCNIFMLGKALTSVTWVRLCGGHLWTCLKLSQGFGIETKILPFHSFLIEKVLGFLSLLLFILFYLGGGFLIALLGSYSPPWLGSLLVVLKHHVGLNLRSPMCKAYAQSFPLC